MAPNGPLVKREESEAFTAVGRGALELLPWESDQKKTNGWLLNCG